MTGSTASSASAEGPSYNLETKCGWKGVLKSAIAINPLLWNLHDDNHHGTIKNHTETANDSSSHTTSSSSGSSAVLNATRSGGSEPSTSFPSVQDVALHWMGGEPSKYDNNLEQRGVMSILKALTDTERDEIISFDMTVPIRHLRAEKVCSEFPRVREYVYVLFSNVFRLSRHRVTLQKLSHK